MKKIISLIIVCILIVSGMLVGAGAIENDEEIISTQLYKSRDLSFRNLFLQILDRLIERFPLLEIIEQIIYFPQIYPTLIEPCIVSLPPDTITTITMMHSGGGSISDYSLTFYGIPSGYDISDGDSPYPGWCIDKSTHSPTSPPYPVVFYSTYCTPTKWDDPEWDKVNYLLNNLPAGYLVTDVRDAIYPFVNFGPGANPPLSTAAQAIVDDADANGSGFIPVPGQVVAVICDNNPTYPTTPGDDGHPYQYFIIEVPVPEEDEGCTPGFWKNKGVKVGWPSPYNPTANSGPATTLGDVFSIPIPSLINDNDKRQVHSSDTLLYALNYKGGDGVSGMAQSLLRAAVAALLNAAEEEVNYKYSVGEVISMVDAALGSLDRETMEDLKDDLDDNNNLGANKWW